MNDIVTHISLKAFWEAVEQRLAAGSLDDLRGILRAMAQDAPPSGRAAFLARLNVEPKETAEPPERGADDDLIADIDDWIAEFQEVREASEPPGEDYDYDWRGGYNDEDSIGPYTDLVDPLIELFDRAEAAFDYGNLSLAREAYERLFTDALNQEDDYGRGVHVEDLSTIDAPEARARYLRAVYETEAPAQRAGVMFDAMVGAGSWLAQPRVNFDDVIQISPKPLPDRDRFFADWIAYLRPHPVGNADDWLREAVRLTQGTRGLEELARAEGGARPLAFVDWAAARAAEGKPRDVIAAARLALETLHPGLPIRAEIADYLCTAAAGLNEPNVVRWGRWEAFMAQPALARLIDLWEAAPDLAERMKAMQQAAQYGKETLSRPRPEASGLMGGQSGLAAPAVIRNSVLVHAHLLAGEWQEAQVLAAGNEVLGWSNSENVQGLAVPFFLTLLAGPQPGPLPANVDEIWGLALGNTTDIGTIIPSQGNLLGNRLRRAYQESISGTTLGTAEADRIQAWCLEIARKRVAEIVGNQHRGSYNKAAALTVACVEVLWCRGQKQAGDRFLGQIREQFPRHRSFQDELKTAIVRMRKS